MGNYSESNRVHPGSNPTADAATPEVALPLAQIGWRWGAPKVLDLIVVRRGVYSNADKIMLVSRRIKGLFGLALGRLFIGALTTDDMDIHDFALAADSDPVGAAEREVGRYIYRRIEALMGGDSEELDWLSSIVANVEEYGEEACAADELAPFPSCPFTNTQAVSDGAGSCTASGSGAPGVVPGDPQPTSIQDTTGEG